MRAGRVGLVLARAGDGKLDQRRRDRCDDDHQQSAEAASAALPPVASAVAAEQGSPVAHARDQRNRAGQRRGDRAGEDVAILDVAEFVRQYAFQLLIGQQAENPMGHGDRRVLRIPAGRKRVGRLGGNHVDLRHRDAILRGQPLDDVIGARQLLTRHGLRAIHRKRDLVGVEIRGEVHRDRDHERQNHPILAADPLTKEEENQHQRYKQKRRFERIHTVRRLSGRWLSHSSRTCLVHH